MNDRSPPTTARSRSSFRRRGTSRASITTPAPRITRFPAARCSFGDVGRGCQVRRRRRWRARRRTVPTADDEAIPPSHRARARGRLSTRSVRTQPRPSASRSRRRPPARWSCSHVKPADAVRAGRRRGTGVSATCAADHDRRRSGASVATGNDAAAPRVRVAGERRGTTPTSIDARRRSGSSTRPVVGDLLPCHRASRPSGHSGERTPSFCGFPPRAVGWARLDRVHGMRVGVLASGSGTILRALLERGLPIVVVRRRPAVRRARHRRGRRRRGRARRAHRLRPGLRPRRVHARRRRRARSATTSTSSRSPASARSCRSRSSTRSAAAR